ncbi:hypothetical protein AB0H71_33635 [Nocardia sp. NPDC050697]|uniref:hypothetical protein n=1 Tax=Nocardia sp. NPDC050697 TaxID=3155158 RepID=UPI0033D60254
MPLQTITLDTPEPGAVDLLVVARPSETRQQISDLAANSLIAATKTSTAKIRIHIRQRGRLIFHRHEELSAVLTDLSLWGRDSDAGGAQS